MALVSQQISNHKVFTDVKRFVDVDGFLINNTAKTITVFYAMRYENGDGKDVSANFNQNVNPLVGTNQTRTIVRDENNEPVPDPDYDPATSTDETDKYKTEPSYDYLADYLGRDVSTLSVIGLYIILSDGDGKFDFLKQPPRPPKEGAMMEKNIF